MNRILLLIFLPLVSWAQVPQLSPSAEINVITCGPGQNELYSAFGHSAFRVVDPVNGIDYVYDFGVFDFNQPNFYLNFARGHLNYKLARREYASFLNYYVYFNRYFTEQQLNLTSAERQDLFDYLEWNNLPENQYYSYDYFYDNCATKIPEVLKTVLGESLVFDDSYLTEEKSIRELTDDYLGYQPWGDLGIDICLGLPMDKTASPEVHQFLPEYVRMAFDNAFIKDGDKLEPLVKRTYDTYTQRPEKIEETVITPSVIFWSLFIVISLVSFIMARKGKLLTGFDIAYFGILGILGVFLLLLWLATDHRAAAYNLNILWAFPLHIWGAILLFRRKEKSITYFKWSAYGYLVLGLIWFFLPQLMHYSLFPLVLLALSRSVIQWKREDIARS